MVDSIAQYRAKVLAAHQPAFNLFTQVAGALEDAITVPRKHPALTDMVIDMLMVQAFKAYGAVALLAQHGLMEDSATIARRLLELSVQAVYVGAESEERVRERKAGRYLSFMWRQLPRRIKHRLPAGVRTQWTTIARKYARFVPRKARSWGPNWREMFREIGAEPTYKADYGFLSAIAHGSPDNQVFVFSQSRIRLHSHRFVSILLGYATKYCLMTTEQWNNRFKIIAPKELATLIRHARRFRPTGGAV